jgi:hypothetical protein
VPPPPSARMARPDTSPEPPPDLASRTLPITKIPAGKTLIRIHRRELGALYFGGGHDNRFDAPDGGYGVCYMAQTLEGAFAETCLRNAGDCFVTRDFLAERVFSVVPVAGTLRVVALHGPGLIPIGATAAVTSGDYRVARRWSAALHAHPDGIDGIAYFANHDNTQLCVALFERGRAQIGPPGPSEGLLDDLRRLGSILNRYKMGLG